MLYNSGNGSICHRFSKIEQYGRSTIARRSHVSRETSDIGGVITSQLPRFCRTEIDYDRPGLWPESCQLYSQVIEQSSETSAGF